MIHAQTINLIGRARVCSTSVRDVVNDPSIRSRADLGRQPHNVSGQTMGTLPLASYELIGVMIIRIRLSRNTALSSGLSLFLLRWWA